MKLTSPVISGHGRGKLLGFPTFNLKIPPELSAKHGIYAAWVWIGGQKYQGALHFGPVPTFKNPRPSLEIFLLDYADEEPVHELTFELVSYLRPIEAFASPEALAQQIAEDVSRIRQLLDSQ